MNTPEKTFLGSGKFTFVKGATSEATFKTVLDGDAGGDGDAVLTPVFDVNGGIESVTIEDGGNNYTDGDIVVVSGPGTGFAATFTTNLGVIDSVTVTNAGSGYQTDFGNLVSISMNASKEELKHYGSYSGVRRVDRTVITQAELAYTLRLDEIDKRIIEVLVQAAAGTGTKTGYTALEPLKDFNIKGIGCLEIQDVDDEDGSPRIIHEYFGCELKVDGAVDFNPQNWSEASLVVTMTNPKGTFWVKD